MVFGFAFILIMIWYFYEIYVGFHNQTVGLLSYFLWDATLSNSSVRGNRITILLSGIRLRVYICRQNLLQISIYWYLSINKKYPYGIIYQNYEPKVIYFALTTYSIWQVSTPFFSTKLLFYWRLGFSKDTNSLCKIEYFSLWPSSWRLRM